MRGLARFRSLGLALALAALGTLALAAGTGTSPTASAQHEDEGEAHGDAEGELGEEAAASEEHGEHGHHPGIGDMFWLEAGPNGEPPFAGRVLSFFLWAFIIVYFGRKPIADFLAVRRKAIVDGLEEARRVEAAAQAKHEEYTARIENLDHEIAKLREEFKRAGMEERDRMVAEASGRAEKMHAEAKFLVDQQLKTLRQELTREAIEAAVGAAEKILRERATAADQQRLADEYLARLRASVERGTGAAGTGPKGAS